MLTSPIEELRSRLDRHGSRVAKVKLNHNPCDGGPRTLVQLFNGSGEKLDEWEDWVLPNDDAERILKEYWGVVERSPDSFGYVCTFTVCGSRKRTEARP